MSIRYDFLLEDDFGQVHETMTAAFSDYHVDMSYMTRERSWQRNIKSGVHYDCSVGAFDENKMVGFTFVGLDDWMGEQAAFDAGTGIIKEYRGQGIAKAMFEFVLPRLRERGISMFLLEVLEPNEAAIKAYTKTGFQKSRKVACYDLFSHAFAGDKLPISPFEIRTIDGAAVQEFKTLVDWQPSWENSFSGMDRIQDELIRLGAFKENECIGILVYYPTLDWIMSLVVKNDHRRRGAASDLMRTLMECLPESADKVKINNVDRKDQAMMAFFEKVGATWVIDQFEMEYNF